MHEKKKLVKKEIPRHFYDPYPTRHKRFPRAKTVAMLIKQLQRLPLDLKINGNNSQGVELFVCGMDIHNPYLDIENLYKE